MRRFTSQDRIAWLRLTKKRAKRPLKQKLKLKQNKQNRRKRRNKIKKISIANTQAILRAPAAFELISRENHNKTLEFLASLRDRALIHKAPIKIDFYDTKRMVVCGTLLFYSELCRIKRELGSLDLISCNQPEDETVAQVLQHLGILKMLGCHCSITPERADVINWKIAAGDKTDASEAGKILEMQSKLPVAKSKKLYRGVSEAMTNVSQHAYLDLRNDGAEIAGDKGWWMFCREEDDHIFVAFCDLGVGIPVTLPKTIEENNDQNRYVKILQKLLGSKKTKYSDGPIIRAAIEVKRSRTLKSHRGKGLLDMIKAIESTGGRLAILSNKGGYLYNVNNSEPSEVVKNYRDSILGTLILWSLPLNADTEVKI
jgi:hypothetical protein